MRICSTIFPFVLIQYQQKSTQYNTLNVKFSNSKLNKLRSRIKTDTEVTLKTLSNVAGDSNDEMIIFCISCY